MLPARVRTDDPQEHLSTVHPYHKEGYVETRGARTGGDGAGWQGTLLDRGLNLNSDFELNVI